MESNVKQISANDMDWLLSKIKQYDKSIKIHSIIELILTVLDVIFFILTFFYVSLFTAYAITSLLWGGVVGSRAIMVLRIKRLLGAIKVPTMIGITYCLTRLKRREFMQNIKIRNWIIAGLDACAIILGIILVFVEPNAITDNIIAVIMGLGSLLGVNIAIPCFNNAQLTDEDKAKAKVKKEARNLSKQAKANLKAEQKAKEQNLINAEMAKIKVEQEKAEAEAQAQANAQNK